LELATVDLEEILRAPVQHLRNCLDRPGLPRAGRTQQEKDSSAPSLGSEASLAHIHVGYNRACSRGLPYNLFREQRDKIPRGLKDIQRGRLRFAVFPHSNLPPRFVRERNQSYDAIRRRHLTRKQVRPLYQHSLDSKFRI